MCTDWRRELRATRNIAVTSFFPVYFLHPSPGIKTRKEAKVAVFYMDEDDAWQEHCRTQMKLMPAMSFDVSSIRWRK